MFGICVVYLVFSCAEYLPPTTVSSPNALVQDLSFSCHLLRRLRYRCAWLAFSLLGKKKLQNISGNESAKRQDEHSTQENTKNIPNDFDLVIDIFCRNVSKCIDLVMIRFSILLTLLDLAILCALCFCSLICLKTTSLSYVFDKMPSAKRPHKPDKKSVCQIMDFELHLQSQPRFERSDHFFVFCV